jgi:hypothetical protein
MRFYGVVAPERPGTPDGGPPCAEAAEMADRGRDMVEGFILAAGRYSYNGFDGEDGTGHVRGQLSIPMERGGKPWRILDEVLLHYGLAVEGDYRDPPPDSCALAKDLLSKQNACAHAAFAAWTKRAQAGFPTSQDKAAAFEQHVEALEACR